MKLSTILTEFLQSEKIGGVILVAVTILSLSAANSSLGSSYISFWDFKLFGLSLTHWINDGLMAIFFLLIGLELEREIYSGELSNFKKASLPVFAALGGMLVPAAIYIFLNLNSATSSGAGIPMATDIAFAIGILSLLGKRVPASLKIFLTAFAVIDDLGAILIIAIFYSSSLNFVNLSIALGIFFLLLVLNRMKVRSLPMYLSGGIIMWFFMLGSGVHATITGVMLAFAVPFASGSSQTPSYILQHRLHKPVAFLILPVFAAANTGVVFTNGWYGGLLLPHSLGIISGLTLGKPLGILVFSYLSVKVKLAVLPAGMKWSEVLGAGMLGGIGFTMSIFITLLAFNDPQVIDSAKIAIFAASVCAGSAGFILLKKTLRAA